MAVHPAYWRQGHGQRLAAWCLALADLDGMPTSVSAAPMGVGLSSRLGFKEVDIIKLYG